MFKVVVDRLCDRHTERVEHLTRYFETKVEAQDHARDINCKAFTPFMAYVQTK